MTSQSPDHLVRYGVSGFGRVGTYTQAKREGRSRARRFWMVTVFDARPRNPDRPIEGLIGQVPVLRLGKHRSKKAAIKRLLEFAEEAGGVVAGDLSGYPTVTLTSAIESELSREEIGDLFDSLRSPSGQTPRDAQPTQGFCHD